MDCVEVYKRHSIRLKILKTGVITAEPPYHAQAWEYPHREWARQKWTTQGSGPDRSGPHRGVVQTEVDHTGEWFRQGV